MCGECDCRRRMSYGESGVLGAPAVCILTSALHVDANLPRQSLK